MKVLKTIQPNVMTSLITSTENTCRLPLSVVKGSEKERYALAGRYTQQLREGLEKISDAESCKIEDFKNLIKEIVAPNEINVSIVPLKKTFLSGTRGTISVKSEYKSKTAYIGDVLYESTHKKNKGYKISLSLSNENTEISDKYAAFHEMRHLFDQICNPKTIESGFLGICDEDKKVKAFSNTYKAFVSDTNIFYRQKDLKSKADKNLDKLSDEEAINCLQHIRHTLKTEINAYRDTVDYMKEDIFLNVNDIIGVKLFMLMHNYPKRLKLVNKMLAERLKLARDNNRLETTSIK